MPRPVERGEDALDPAGAASHRRRLPFEQLLSGEILGLDELLVGASAAPGGGGAGVLPRAGLGPEDRCSEPLAGRGDAAGVPVGDAALALLVAELLRGAPERGELAPRHPDVGHWDAGDVGLRHAHADKRARTGRRLRWLGASEVAAGSMAAEFALQAARAEEELMDPPAAGRACRPGAKHGRPQRQGCFASLRDDLRPPLTSSLRGRASRSYGGGDSARHPSSGLPAHLFISEVTMPSQTARTAPNTRHWRTDAACRGTDPDLYFPAVESGPVYDRQVANAKAVCADCPVVSLCLEEALVHLPDGVAGGLTADERRAVRRPEGAEADAEELARLACNRSETAAAGAALLAAGRSRRVVAQVCGVSERTVYRWCARLDTTGIR